jgi:hypothetical protein
MHTGCHKLPYPLGVSILSFGYLTLVTASFVFPVDPQSNQLLQRPAFPNVCFCPIDNENAICYIEYRQIALITYLDYLVCQEGDKPVLGMGVVIRPVS